MMRVVAPSGVIGLNLLSSWCPEMLLGSRFGFARAVKIRRPEDAAWDSRFGQNYCVDFIHTKRQVYGREKPKAFPILRSERCHPNSRLRRTRCACRRACELLPFLPQPQ